MVSIANICLDVRSVRELLGSIAPQNPVSPILENQGIDSLYHQNFPIYPINSVAKPVDIAPIHAPTDLTAKAASKHKVLIVKLGYSETLVADIGNRCSLGDVFRTTVVLHLLKNDHVTWLTDKAAIPLLEGNPYIDRILPFDLPSVLPLLGEKYDEVINLEKVPGVCYLVSKISASRHYGFRFDERSNSVNACPAANDALAIGTEDERKKNNNKTLEEVVFSIIGGNWHGETYILGYKPKTEPIYDIGFNMHVGDKFPTKAWPISYWKILEDMVKDKYTCSYQQHLNNLNGYMDWINTCRLLITSDSLGLHLGVALGKKVLALFGPTSPFEISPSHRLRVLTPTVERSCIPCWKGECAHNDVCMSHITPQTVLDVIDDWGVK